MSDSNSKSLQVGVGVGLTISMKDELTGQQGEWEGLSPESWMER